MLEALQEAWKAFLIGEVPIGAVLVQGGRIIAKSHNQVEGLKNATAHAETLCIATGAALLENWRLSNTTLYSTVEPCAMCAGAMLLSRIPLLVWGAPDHRHGANGSWVDLLSRKHPTHAITVRRGVLANYSSTLLREFFQKRRREKEAIFLKNRQQR